MIKTGIEVYNNSSNKYLSPDNSICRIIDVLFIMFGEEPVTMDNHFAFEKYLDDPDYYEKAKQSAVAEYLVTHPKSGTDYDKMSPQDRYNVRNLMQKSFVDRTTVWNQNQKNSIVLHQYLNEGETLFLSTVGNHLRASAVDTQILSDGRVREYKDFSVVKVYFEVPTGNGKSRDYADIGFNQATQKRYLEIPYWGYLIIGAK